MHMSKKEDNVMSFIEQLKKELKDDSIGVTTLSDPANDIVRDPTGILMLDWVCGGGLPLGRWIEIFGKESGGKSLIATLICANAQKRGKLVAWIDMERTADSNWFKRLGIDVDSLLMIKPDSAEGAFKAIEKLVDSGKVSYIVVDSVASMATEGELEEDPGKQNMAVMARMLSTELRKLTGKLDKTKTTVILINQLRSTMAVTKYMKQETTTGGKAIPFYASVRLAVAKLTDAASYVRNDSGDYLAHTIRLKGVKNKVGSPDKTGQFMLIYDGGPDNRMALIALAIERKYITKSGAMYYIDFNGQQISARGEKALLEKLQENKDLQQFLFEALDIHPIYRDMFDADKRGIISASGLAEIAEMPDAQEN